MDSNRTWQNCVWLTVLVERMERYFGAVLHTDLVAGLHFSNPPVSSPKAWRTSDLCRWCLWEEPAFSFTRRGAVLPAKHLKLCRLKLSLTLIPRIMCRLISPPVKSKPLKTARQNLTSLYFRAAICGLNLGHFVWSADKTWSEIRKSPRPYQSSARCDQELSRHLWPMR